MKVVVEWGMQRSGVGIIIGILGIVFLITSGFLLLSCTGVNKEINCTEYHLRIKFLLHEFDEETVEDILDVVRINALYDFDSLYKSLNIYNDYKSNSLFFYPSGLKVSGIPRQFCFSLTVRYRRKKHN